jgi:hypothetical protein
MLFHGNIVTLLAVIASVFVFHGQIAAAIPLGPERMAASAVTTTPTSHDATPWFITRRAKSPEIETLNDRQKAARTYTTIHLVSPETQPSNALQKTKNIARQLHRRASDVVGNNTFITAMFVLLIVLSVLLGMGIASIAVCGFEWRRFLARSETRKDIEQEEGAPNAS